MKRILFVFIVVAIAAFTIQAQSTFTVNDLIGGKRVGDPQLSPDGKTILSGSLDKTARLWDVATGVLVRTFPSHNFSAVSMVAYSPDGQNVLIGSSDGTAQLADVDETSLIRSVCHRLLRDFTDSERSIYSIADANPTCPPAAIQPTAPVPTWTPFLSATGVPRM